MAKDLLWELGVEEVPARFLPPVIKQLRELAEESFKAAGLAYDELRVLATPRRLTLLVNGLAETAADLESEAKGPAVKAAYTASGEPTKALLGFCRGQGVEPEQVMTKQIKGVDYIYVVKKTPGQPALSLLPELLPALADKLYFPKPQRWGYNPKKFIRPIRWVVALFGEDVIDMEYAGVQAGRCSRGHRELGSDCISIASPAVYVEEMRKNFVMVDQDERRRVCWEQIQQVAADLGGTVKEDEELLEEVTYLVEWPTALSGRFEEKYLEMPEELVVTPMREHQRYFPVYGKNGYLLPNFITVRNGDDYHLNVVAEGNEKVLRARLADAEFFYVEDLKDDMSDNVEKLSTVVFHERLGTSRQKVDRIITLAKEIGRRLGFDREEMAQTERAAYLAKSDLESKVVYEFPELQGIIGEYYANAAGEDPVVAQAIREHYLPRFAGDELPQTRAGMAVALADKIDSICGFFAAGMVPTGSQDPFALRRAASGCTQIIIANQLDLPLRDLLKLDFDLLRVDVPQEYQDKLKTTPERADNILQFFQQRAENIMSENGVGYDILNAVNRVGLRRGDLAGAFRRAMVLQKYRANEGFARLRAGFTRSANIIRSAREKEAKPADARPQVNEALLTDASEQELYRQLRQVEAAVRPLIDAGDYQAALEEASRLTPYIDAFFDSVMVLDKDEAVRRNRIALLDEIVALTEDIGDISQIVE
ncbi:MAG: glycine--tRNA ligase subunit beta [Firmicutes bacterium]|nr:glycine--tRNA ligase subunit beta [Bacillota bacterium]